MPPVTVPLTASATLMLEPSAAKNCRSPLAAEPVNVMLAAANWFLTLLVPSALSIVAVVTVVLPSELASWTPPTVNA